MVFDRVVECLILFAYTNNIFDIHGKAFDSLSPKDLSNIEIGFDMMELFMLADYMLVDELTDTILHCFTGIFLAQNININLKSWSLSG